jgi:hypothetical protein
MPGLVPGIHVFSASRSALGQSQTWMAGTSPAMTQDGLIYFLALNTNQPQDE